MALLPQRSVDKQIFERAPLSTKITQSTLIFLSLAATEKSGVAQTSSFTQTHTTHSTAAAPLKETPLPRRRFRDLPPLSTAMPTSSERTKQTSCKASSSIAPGCLTTGPHWLCIYIRYKTRCSNCIHTTQTNRSSYSLGFTFSLQK